MFGNVLSRHPTARRIRKRGGNSSRTAFSCLGCDSWRLTPSHINLFSFRFRISSTIESSQGIESPCSLRPSLWNQENKQSDTIELFILQNFKRFSLYGTKKIETCVGSEAWERPSASYLSFLPFKCIWAFPFQKLSLLMLTPKFLGSPSISRTCFTAL